MTDIDDRLRASIEGYLLKHDVFDALEVEEWIRADIEVVVGLSPSRKEELIAVGVRAVSVSISRDWVTILPRR